MVRKCLVLFIVFLLQGLTAFTQDENSNDYSAQILTLEKKFRVLDESIAYLKKNNMEIADIDRIHTEAGGLFREIKDNPDAFKDYDMALQLLSVKVAVLEEKTAERISFARRSAFMYIVMVVAGAGILLFMIIYSVSMYIRRK